MKTNVAQIQILDKNGYWLKRSVFINVNSLNEYTHVFTKKILGKVPRTYTTMREVLYE